MYACAEGRLNIVQVLVAHGADVNAKNANGVTALLFATEYSFVEILKVLLASTADVNAKTNVSVFIDPKGLLRN